tara:strand:- start:5919 stop:6446 length:528 start_codon:yes stop_codon:yes gene_type:complete
MNALKQILKWTLICLLAFCTFNLFISPNYKIQRTITINVPAYVVFEEVTDLQTWPTWATWWQKDTTITIEYTGARYGVNSKISWTGIDGFGSLKITAVSFTDSVNTELNFEGMPPVYGIWNFKETDEGTYITWRMKGEMPFFMRFMTMFFNDMLGPDIEAGLQALKAKCESMPSR